MSLADLLVIRPEFRRRPLAMVELDSAAKRVEQAFPDLDYSVPEDVEATLERVARAVAIKDWQGVTTGDVVRSLHAFLVGAQPMPDVLQGFLTDELSVTTNPRLLDVLARTYLETWKPGSTKTDGLRASILARSEYLPGRWQTLFKTCPEFLDPVSGPHDLGKRMVSTDAPYGWLRTNGLAVPHDQGFMRLAHSAFLRASPDPESTASLAKLLAWITPSGAPALEDDRAAEVVDRILSPWAARTCPADYREHCTRCLTDRFGDPRRDKPAFWALVGDEGKRVLYKWLARKSMEAMFEVVTKAATDADSARLWTNRKRFWLGLYEAGRIDEAWVVLGQEAVPFARALHQQTGDKSYLNFGRQSGRSDTSLLLMKIGSKTVVEGSHNFRVHVFPTPMRRTPSLYLETYDLEGIMLPANHDDARSHIGGWMDWVRDRIRT